MSIFTLVYLSTSAMNGQYRCMYLVALLFKSPSFHLRTDCSLFLVSYCAAVSYFQNTQVSFASDSVPFNSRFFSMALQHTFHWVCISGQIHSFSNIFIVAISLPFKSKDNVFLSILFSGKCGDSHSLPLPLAPSLSFRGHLRGPQSVVLLSACNCLTVMNHDER